MASGDISGMKRLAALTVTLAVASATLVGVAAGAPVRRTAKVRQTTTTTAKATTTSTTTAPTTSTTVPKLVFDATTVSNVRADADWLLQAQLPDGAIGHYVDRVKIWPYLGNEAAVGLARTTEVTGDPKYVAAVWRWLAWYQAHMDPSTGFVTDYSVANGVEASTGDMDSTDAYAGTFLVAARKAWKASGDTTTLATLRTGISRAVTAIEATQDVDGMTWAKPAWHVKYLMDQGETYAGLRSAAEVAFVLGEAALAQRASADADRMATGVAGVWNSANASYDWAKHDTGVHQTTDWSILYSDSLQQAWAVTYGLSTGATACDLMARFATSQPHWANPTATALFTSGAQVVGYWPAAGLGYLRTGQPAQATAAAGTIRSAAVASARAWPFDSGIAGMLLLLESGDADYAP
jgi:hypothetical protein